jgi:S-formylglutathione hydrolase FrmB
VRITILEISHNINTHNLKRRTFYKMKYLAFILLTGFLWSCFDSESNQQESKNTNNTPVDDSSSFKDEEDVSKDSIQHDSTTNDSSAMITNSKKPVKDTTLTLKDRQYEVETLILVPDSASTGVLMLLPGWNYPNTGWGDNTTFCKKALAEGYILVMPQMGKSTYQTYFYPETRKEWLEYPSKSWLIDTLIRHLQDSMDLLIEGEYNFVAGLSTGGRGAALLALELPNIFTGCAALSADFDHARLCYDPIYIGFYGDIKKHPERFFETDNILLQADKYVCPTYLGHGLLDKVAPPDQTEIFYNYVKGKHPNLKLELNLEPNHAHTYAYWGSEVDNMLRFFRECKEL